MSGRGRWLAVLALAALVALVVVLRDCSDGVDAVPRRSDAAAPATAPAADVPGGAKPRRHDPAAKTAHADESAVEDEHLELRVHVVAQETREPICGAEISVASHAGSETARTDEHGDATLVAAAGSYASVEVSAPGRARTSRGFDVDRGVVTLEIALAVGVEVSVQVVDVPTGAPIAGATGAVTLALTRDWIEVPATDAEGRSTFGMAAGDVGIVTMAAAGHLDATEVVRAGPVGGPPVVVRIPMERGGTIRGVVRDPAGLPVAKADVVATWDDGEGWSDPVETGADGAYEIGSLEFGRRYTVTADPPSNTDWEWNEATGLVPTPGQPLVVADLRLRRAGLIRVQIEAPDGADIPGGLRLVSDNRGRTSSSSPTGLATVSEAIGPGRVALRAWMNAGPEDLLPLEAVIEFGEGAMTTGALRFERGVSISGVVVDDTGAPVEEARIRPAKPIVDADAPQPSARTDAEGRFRLAPLPKGPIDLAVLPPFDFDEVVVRGVTAPGDDVRFVVARRGRIALQIALEGDAPPAADARVFFTGSEAGQPWKIDRLLPSDRRVELAWPGGVRGEVWIGVTGFEHVARTLVVPAGTSVDLGEIRLRRESAISGTLLDASGAPVPGAKLVIQGPRFSQSSTDTAGRFTFEWGVGVASGRVRIGCPQSGALPSCAFLVDLPRTTPVVLCLPHAGRLVVMGARPGAHVGLSDAAGGALYLGDDSAGGGGTFEVPLGPGRYALRVGDVPSAEFEIRESDITLVRAGGGAR